jgi:hypothetical protein
MGLYKIIKSALYRKRCNPLKLEELQNFAFCAREKCNIGKYELGTYSNRDKKYIICRLHSKI